MVLKLAACFEGYGIQYDVVMDIIRIQMGSDHDLVLIAPHSFGSGDSNLVCFLGSDLTGFEALKSMVGYIPTQLSKLPFSVHHGSVGILFQTVDGTDIHFLNQL